LNYYVSDLNSMKKLNKVGHFLTHFSGIRTSDLGLLSTSGRKMAAP
jgi:hypothetical protein